MVYKDRVKMIARCRAQFLKKGNDGTKIVEIAFACQTGGR